MAASPQPHALLNINPAGSAPLGGQQAAKQRAEQVHTEQQHHVLLTAQLRPGPAHSKQGQQIAIYRTVISARQCNAQPLLTVQEQARTCQQSPQLTMLHPPSRADGWGCMLLICCSTKSGSGVSAEGLEQAHTAAGREYHTGSSLQPKAAFKDHLRHLP